MNEVGYEETAFPYDYNRQKVLYVICRAVIGIFVFLTVVFIWFFLTFVDVNAWLSAIFIFAWLVLSIVFLEFVKLKLYNCYDYIFVTGELRIIKVVNTRKRKKLIAFDSKSVYQVGRFGSETYERHRKTPGIKTIFAPTNKFEADKPKYYIAVNSEGAKYLVVLECTETLLRYVLQFSGKTVLEKEYYDISRQRGDN